MTDLAAPQRVDPRNLLSEWANASDEWVRFIVRHVLQGGGPLGSEEEADAYALFRQEKAFDTRELAVELPLATFESEDEAIEPLTLTSLSGVTGVNALVEGGLIEPHEGLTILFGENGTGKTGYSRIFKALRRQSNCRRNPREHRRNLAAGEVCRCFLHAGFRVQDVHVDRSARRRPVYQDLNFRQPLR